MSESGVLSDLRSVVAEAGGMPVESATAEELAETITSVRAAIDALEGVEAAALSQFDQIEGYRDMGASSTAGWARRELRLDGRSARARVRAGRTLRQLPEVAAASRSGAVRLEHVQVFTMGITKVGAEAMSDAESILLPVARTCDPTELRGTINTLIDAVDPDRLDRAYAEGMEKVDLKVAKCRDGFHVTGFLDIATGAAFQTWLHAAAAPRNAEDERIPSARRIDAIRALVSSVLEHGMPCDRGVRPQLHVIVSAETLLGTRAGHEPGDMAADPVGEAATLTGFGPIGADLLGYLRCTADQTPILVAGETNGPLPQADVLNVGRSSRCATWKQRAAVRLRQEGICANPGCANTHLEIHHVAWWERDHGSTDLDNLIGLCPACHHLVHANRLEVRPDGSRGFTLHRAGGRRIEDERRAQRARIRRHLRKLRSLHQYANDPGTAERSDPRQYPARPPGRRHDGRHGRGSDQHWPSPGELHLTMHLHNHRPRPPMRT